LSILIQMKLLYLSKYLLIGRKRITKVKGQRDETSIFVEEVLLISNENRFGQNPTILE